MISRHAFGSRLRAQREQRGVTLESIADSTKIKLSLLSSLERGDASHWPRGLFRRAYLRDYACAIGAPPEPLVTEFVRLFPEDGSPAHEETGFDAEPMRLTFAEEPHTRLRRAASRCGAALVELGAVAAVGAGASFAAGWPLMAACGAVALVYYPLAAAAMGRTLSSGQLRLLLRHRPAHATGAGLDASPEPAPLYLVSRHQTASAQLVSAVTGEEFVQPRTAAR